MLWDAEGQQFLHGLPVLQTDYQPFDVHKYGFKGKELSIIILDPKNSPVVGVIKEFEGLSEKDLEEACVFTI